LAKIGPVDLEFFLFKSFIFKKKLTQAEHVTRGASMQRWLNCKQPRVLFDLCANVLQSADNKKLN